MNQNESMECRDAAALVPSYLDGELSEAQAAPLRKHLLACQPCRGSAQADKNLKRWFVPSEPVAVPRDFAARVARRAFAGDRGQVFAPAAVEAPVAAPVLAPARANEGEILTFVLRVTAIAAGLLLVVSIAIRASTLPSSERLMADDRPAATLDETLQRLDELNGEAKNGAAKPAKAARTSPQPVVQRP